MVRLMTSSKAISTSRKRTKRLALLFIFTLMLLAPAFAGEYRIGLVLDGEIDRFSTLLGDALSFSSSRIESPGLIASNSNRLEREHEIADGIERDRQKRSERKHEEKAYKVDESPIVGRIVNLDLDDVSLKYLKKGDMDAVSYIKHREKLDEIVYVESVLTDGLYEIRLDIDGREMLFTLHSEMLGGLEKEVLPVLLEHYRGVEHRLLSVKGNVGAAITENGKEVEKFSSYYVLPLGMHEIRFEQIGYGSYSTVVDVDEDLETIEYQLERQKGDKLYISSRPYPDTLYLNGNRLDGLFAEEASLPFTLTAAKDGYVTRTVQSAKARDTIELQLLPVTFYDKDKLIEEKKSFYTHLLSTLLSFGVSVASETLDRMLPETDLSLVTAGLYGLTTTGVVMMIDSLFDYKNALMRSY